MAYICQITTHIEPVYLKFRPYGRAVDIDDASKFESEDDAYSAYLSSFSFPEDYENSIKEGKLIVIEVGQLSLF